MTDSSMPPQLPPAKPAVQVAEAALHESPPVNKRPRRRLKWGRLVLFVLFAAGLSAAVMEPEKLGLPKNWVTTTKDRAVALVPTPTPEEIKQAEEAKKPKPALLPTVTVFAAATGSVKEQIIVNGTLVPRTEVMVVSEIEGLAVQQIMVDEGDVVQEGQVLAKLNRVTLEVQMAQNKAQIARANAGIAQARSGITQSEATKTERDRALGRIRLLKKQGFATNAQMDQGESGAAVAEAQVQSSIKAVDVAVADKEALMAAREDLEWRMTRTEVKAPVAGTISRKGARVGMIASGASVEALFRIIANGDVELEADVADNAMPKLAIGQKVAVTLAGSTVAVQGDIRLIRPEIDPQSRLGKVRVRLPRDASVILGASARGLIDTGAGEGVLLPLSAIGFGKDRAIIQVVEGNTVRIRTVELGVIGEDRAEVRSGVKAGELVVTRAGTFLKDGDKVRAVKEGQSAALPAEAAPTKQADASAPTTNEQGPAE
jgi:HlyD family secretion protein